MNMDVSKGKRETSLPRTNNLQSPIATNKRAKNPSKIITPNQIVTIRGLLYAKEMTFRERMARLQFSVTSPMASAWTDAEGNVSGTGVSSWIQLGRR